MAKRKHHDDVEHIIRGKEHEARAVQLEEVDGLNSEHAYKKEHQEPVGGSHDFLDAQWDEDHGACDEHDGIARLRQPGRQHVKRLEQEGEAEQPQGNARLAQMGTKGTHCILSAVLDAPHEVGQAPLLAMHHDSLPKHPRKCVPYPQE